MINLKRDCRRSQGLIWDDFGREWWPVRGKLGPKIFINLFTIFSLSHLNLLWLVALYVDQIILYVLYN